MALFSINDKEELLALFKTLMEAKFHHDPDSLEVQGSPIVARICERVAEALITTEEREYNWGNAQRWREHFSHAENKQDCMRVVRKHLSIINEGLWQSFSAKQKETMIKDLLSPFVASNKLIIKLIKEKEEPIST